MLEYTPSKGWWYSLGSDDWTLLEEKKKITHQIKWLQLNSWDILLCSSSQSQSLGLGKPLFPILKSLDIHFWPNSYQLTLSPMKSSKGSLPEFPTPQTHLYLPSPDLTKEGSLPDRRLHLLAVHVTIPHGLFQNFTLSPLFKLLLLFSYPLVLKHLQSSFKKMIPIYVYTHTQTN